MTRPKGQAKKKSISEWGFLFLLIVASLLIPTLVAVIGSRLGMEDGWYGATGTWVGAISSTGAIVWAIRVFLRDRAVEEHDDRTRRDIAQRTADDVAITVSPQNSSYNSKHYINCLFVTVHNKSLQPLNVYDAEIDRLPDGARKQWGDAALHLKPMQQTILKWAVGEIPVDSKATIETLHQMGYFAHVTFKQGQDTWTKTSRDETATCITPQEPAIIDS